jgi:hypothetical protein
MRWKDGCVLQMTHREAKSDVPDMMGARIGKAEMDW